MKPDTVEPQLLENAPGSIFLSVLLPVYNYDARNLIKSLIFQLKAAELETELSYELLVANDGSAQDWLVLYENFHKSENFPEKKYNYLANEINIGRAAIRNFLSRQAKGRYLLFLDCDSALPDSDFINRYLRAISLAEVLAGGTIYQTERPQKKQILRWKYGRLREQIPAKIRNKTPYAAISLNNLLISRAIFEQTGLDENIRTYGHEDTRFGYRLATEGVKLVHIDNAVIHLGLEDNAVFIEKTRQAAANFYTLFMAGLGHESKLGKAYFFLHKFNFERIFLHFYYFLKPFIMKNLTEGDPNISFLDFVKLAVMAEKGLKEKRSNSQKGG